MDTQELMLSVFQSMRARAHGHWLSMQALLPRGASHAPSAALSYIFQPAAADIIVTGVLCFCLLALRMPPLPAFLLFLLVCYTASTCLLHTINKAKLSAQESLLSPAQSQLQLFKLKHEKLQRVIDQVTEMQSAIASGQQAERELEQLQNEHDQMQKKLELQDGLRMSIQKAQHQLSSLPRLHTRLQQLKHKAMLCSRLKWACKLLRTETSQAAKLQQEFAKLKDDRAQVQAVRAQIAALQTEANEVAQLRARASSLKQQAEEARALRSQIGELERGVSDSPVVWDITAKENKPGVARAGQAASGPPGTGDTAGHADTQAPRPSQSNHGCEGIMRPLGPAPLNENQITLPRTKAAGALGEKSPASQASGSKIPACPLQDSQHKQQQPQQQQQRGSMSGSHGGSGSVGPGFSQSPNPVYQPKPTSSASSRTSQASSGVASFSTSLRNPVYGDPMEACPPTPAFYTPGLTPAFTPGPEAAAFAAALEAGLPLSQLMMGASKMGTKPEAHSSHASFQRPTPSASSSISQPKPQALDFNAKGAAAPAQQTPTSGVLAGW